MHRCTLDFGAIGVVIAVVLSALASALAVLAARIADPVATRALRAQMLECRDDVLHMRDVELPRMLAQAESVLERADMRFDSAESKRKTVAGRLQRTEQAAPANHMDESLSDGERRAALRLLIAQKSA